MNFRDRLNWLFPMEKDVLVWNGWKKSGRQWRRSVWLGLVIGVGGFAEFFLLALYASAKALFLACVGTVFNLATPFIFTGSMLFAGFRGRIADRKTWEEVKRDAVDA